MRNENSDTHKNSSKQKREKRVKKGRILNRKTFFNPCNCHACEVWVLFSLFETKKILKGKLLHLNWAYMYDKVQWNIFLIGFTFNMAFSYFRREKKWLLVEKTQKENTNNIHSCLAFISLFFFLRLLWRQRSKNKKFYRDFDKFILLLCTRHDVIWFFCVFSFQKLPLSNIKPIGFMSKRCSLRMSHGFKI